MSSRIFFSCSFDDGDIHDLRLAELLVKYDLKGTFYIPRACDLVSKSLTDDQIRQLSSVVEIGGHTLNHRILTRIKKQEALEEISGCKRWLEDVTGKEITSFCPPTGRFNNTHIDQQKAVGFRLMRTVEMCSYSTRGHKLTDDFLIMPTTVQVYDHHKTAYIKNSIKRGNLNNFFLLGKLYANNWETMSMRFLRYLENYSEREGQPVIFHLWGHSWEIEKYALWDRLEIFFKSVSEMSAIVSCDNTTLSQIVRTSK